MVLPVPLVASSHRIIGAGGYRSSVELAQMAVWALQYGGGGSVPFLILSHELNK